MLAEGERRNGHNHVIKTHRNVPHEVWWPRHLRICLHAVLWSVQVTWASIDGAVCFYNGSHGVRRSHHYKVNRRRNWAFIYVHNLQSPNSSSKHTSAPIYFVMWGDRNVPLVHSFSRQKFYQVNMFKISACSLWKRKILILEIQEDIWVEQMNF